MNTNKINIQHQIVSISLKLRSKVSLLFDKVSTNCWIFAFAVFRKKSGDAVLAGFGCAVLIAFIAEHINNYFIREKK